MESGLVGRNNRPEDQKKLHQCNCLNGVRPSWPEQYVRRPEPQTESLHVSMESGLVGRNNEWRLYRGAY